MTKKLLITSSKYPPLISPRAFRTEELVKEFSKRGYEIDLFVPEAKFDREFNYVNYFCVDSNNNYIQKDKKRQAPNKGIKNYRLFRKNLGRFFRYIIGESPNSVKYSIKLYDELKKNVLDKEYDLIISIGLPFYVHVATSRFIKKSKQQGIKICDYGDPFFYNPTYKRMYLLKIFEKMIIKQFDYITIPTIKSVTYYSEYKERSKIKVIPQGFDFSLISNFDYIKNKVPTFCYAGVFYKNIRNPEFLFKFLASIESDFQFIIYTSKESIFSQEIINKYKNLLGEKLIVRNFIPRVELIKEMSKMDFLINFENHDSNQMPSKIIDYSLSKRPILSINNNNFNKDLFLSFLNGNYDGALKINLKDYDIRTVVDQFEDL